MKEILFRAKRLEDGKWVEGFCYKMNETTYAFADDYEKNPVPTHYYILFERMTDWGLPNQMYQVEVDGKTVCQYTGLTDKNSRKIFEGDIVRYIDEVTRKEKVDEIEYNETHAAFCRLHKSDMGLQCLFIDEAIANKCEVTGNIFDNPELLTINHKKGADEYENITNFF